MSTFHVVNSNGPTIIGLPTCRALKLVTLNYAMNIVPTAERNTDTTADVPIYTTQPKGDESARANILNEYADVFDGNWVFRRRAPHNTRLNCAASSAFSTSCASSTKRTTQDELDTLVQQGIIAKVDRPTDWVNSGVYVTKLNGKLRLCLDPKDLNKTITIPHHYTPMLDDVLPKLNGAPFFTILDARSGYWNITLDEESSYHTTFNTPYGRHRFKRLPFGLNCAQYVFQKKVHETFSDIPGVIGISDDIIVVGYKSDGSEHDANLTAVLERAQATGLCFNDKKMVVRCKCIPFFGNIIGADDIEPDLEKMTAICNMTAPTAVKELKTFLGMANYLGRFISHLATVSAPLRALCKPNVPYDWGPEHDAEFSNLRKAISSNELLRYYDSAMPLVIQVDASQRGLGAALLQANGPIAFASKSMTETESRYSNIERDMLGIVCGLERFHQYIY